MGGNKKAQEGRKAEVKESDEASGSGAGGEKVSLFMTKLYSMVDDVKTNHAVRWSESGLNFVIPNAEAFAKDFLPQFYKHNNFASFLRQLNMYRFSKLANSNKGKNNTVKKGQHHLWEFNHPNFRRGRTDLLHLVTRKPSAPSPQADGKPKNKDAKGVQEQLGTLLEQMQAMTVRQAEMEARLERLEEENEELADKASAAEERERRQSETNTQLTSLLASIVESMGSRGDSASAAASARMHAAADLAPMGGADGELVQGQSVDYGMKGVKVEGEGEERFADGADDFSRMLDVPSVGLQFDEMPILGALGVGEEDGVGVGAAGVPEFDIGEMGVASPVGDGGYGSLSAGGAGEGGEGAPSASPSSLSGLDRLDMALGSHSDVSTSPSLGSAKAASSKDKGSARPRVSSRAKGAGKGGSSSSRTPRLGAAAAEKLEKLAAGAPSPTAAAVAAAASNDELASSLEAGAAETTITTTTTVAASMTDAAAAASPRSGATRARLSNRELLPLLSLDDVSAGNAQGLIASAAAATAATAAAAAAAVTTTATRAAAAAAASSPVVTAALPPTPELITSMWATVRMQEAAAASSGTGLGGSQIGLGRVH